MPCWWRQRDLSQDLFALDLMRGETRLASFLITRDTAGEIIPEQTALFINPTEDLEDVDEVYWYEIWEMIQSAEGLAGSLREILLEMEPHLFREEIEMFNTSGGLHLYVADEADWESRYEEVSGGIAYKLLRYSWLWPSPYDRRN